MDLKGFCSKWPWTNSGNTPEIAWRDSENARKVFARIAVAPVQIKKKP
jgi:hypothetical protein